LIVEDGITGLYPVRFEYDATTGFLQAAEQGPDPNDPLTMRRFEFEPDAKQRVGTLRDPLGQEFMFDYDDADRVSLVTLPDSSVVAFRYDNNGNLEGVIPPGRP
jgi:YD repeat-containing protein